MKLRNVLLPFAAIGSAIAASSANAELATAVTAGITAAQTDLTALYGALTTAGVAVFVAAIIYRKFRLR